MGDRVHTGKPQAAEAPHEAGARDGRGQALRRLAPQDGREHPSSGRLEAVSDYDEQAQRYLILIEGGPPSNYSAWSPDLPGCVATGGSLEEVEREMRAAIALHLVGILEDGGEIPAPSGPGVYVERKPRAAA
jgi:predicted RNase H-like HicB family nuclease